MKKSETLVFNKDVGEIYKKLVKLSKTNKEVFGVIITLLFSSYDDFLVSKFDNEELYVLLDGNVVISLIDVAETIVGVTNVVEILNENKII